MRRNRKSNMKKERIIMLASSAFVLAALTMTGIYMKNGNAEAQDDGYTLDFTAMEDNAENKLEEIAQNVQEENSDQLAKNEVRNQTGNTTYGNTNLDIMEDVTEDDLDYMPLEVGSGMVEIPGLTDTIDSVQEEVQEITEIAEAEVIADKPASAENVVVEQTLRFEETEGLLRPASGEVLLPYSMDKSVYFSTLDQYKYNSAVMISAEVGAEVPACADGKVIDIFTDAEIGNAVTLDLGDGYHATYGQLNEINVAMDSYVNAGEKLGVVATPTIYYTLEGSNVYFSLTKDGVAVNPEDMFQ